VLGIRWLSCKLITMNDDKFEKLMSEIQKSQCAASQTKLVLH